MKGSHETQVREHCPYREDLHPPVSHYEGELALRARYLLPLRPSPQKDEEYEQGDECRPDYHENQLCHP